MSNFLVSLWSHPQSFAEHIDNFFLAISFVWTVQSSGNLELSPRITLLSKFSKHFLFPAGGTMTNGHNYDMLWSDMDCDATYEVWWQLDHVQATYIALSVSWWILDFMLLQVVPWSHVYICHNTPVFAGLDVYAKFYNFSSMFRPLKTYLTYWGNFSVSLSERPLQSPALEFKQKNLTKVCYRSTTLSISSHG